jgi:hypothetical protein
MQYTTFAVRFFSLSLLLIIIAAVLWMIYHGDIDVRQLLTQAAPSIGTGASSLLVIGVTTCFLLAAIAPLIYAARSGDLFTIIVSIFALVVCFVLITGSRTVISSPTSCAGGGSPAYLWRGRSRIELSIENGTRCSDCRHRGGSWSAGRHPQRRGP